MQFYKEKKSMKTRQLKWKNRFLDDNVQENVVSYYLMEDQEQNVYGIGIEKQKENSDVIEWDEIEKVSHSMAYVERIVRALICYQVTPVSLAESVDMLMVMEEEEDDTSL